VSQSRSSGLTGYRGLDALGYIATVLVEFASSLNKPFLLR
jgi:hypothetical protein